MKTRKTRSSQEVKEEFLRKGMSIGAWADRHGFSRPTVSQVISGKNRGTRGEGHKIAVMLGLKDGEITEVGCHE